MISLVAKSVDEQVKPSVRELEAANEYPEQWIEAMKEMGIFGLLRASTPAAHLREGVRGR